MLKDGNGNPYGVSPWVGQELTNPEAYMQTRLGNFDWDHNIIGNVFLQIEPLKGLKFRSTVGAKLAFWGNDSFTPEHYLNAIRQVTINSFERTNNERFNWNNENTLSYEKSINKHNFTILLGQGSYLDGAAQGFNVKYLNLPVDNFEDASLEFNPAAADRISDGYESPAHTLNSLFVRVNYDYDERYLLTAIMRRDGSSKFGGNNKYGYFNSFSAGWVPSRENFWPVNTVVNFLKVRGGYGVVGNDNIGDHLYLSTISGGRNYTMGNTPGYAIGFSPNAPSNPDLKWEQTSQTNIGLEATIFNDFNLTFEWYKKKTTGILRYPRIPAYVGAISNPAANTSDLENTGLELELGYKKRIGALDLSLNGNVAHTKNKITYLGRDIVFVTDQNQTFQAMSNPITRMQVGESVNAFFGYDMLGIFQTQEQVVAHTNSEGKIIQPNALPGDVIWADLDDDGDIDSEDRKFIGNPFPKWTFGVTLTAAYKGFDLLVFGQGVAGNDIFQGLRRLDVSNVNWQTESLGRWTGPGTSNEQPRVVEGDPNNNGNLSRPSKLYLEKGDYFRIKTLQLGYSIPKSLISKIGLQKARIYVMSENLVTFTKYTGYDPDVGGEWQGIDRGRYPQARSFMIGAQIGL
jgi:TonB-linked SusC/RagA family outer membrane protein